jgi:hypothetical protein
LESEDTTGAADPPSPSPFNPLVEKDEAEDKEDAGEEDADEEEVLTAGAGVNVNSEGWALIRNSDASPSLPRTSTRESVTGRVA